MGRKLPLRLGMIGLSSNAATSWAAKAHLPGLITEAGKAHFTIVALCNSSQATAQSAAQTFNLEAADVRTYGSPDDLAADANVDVVSCNTRVDRHYETILPSIKKGKDVFVEWPIASNRAQIQELVATARQSGSRVAVGLQGRWAPPVVKMRELVQSGRLGKVLSSEVRAYGGVIDRQSLPTSLAYFARKEIGGNPMVIGFGHLIDLVQSAVGELVPGQTQAHTQIQRPKIKIVEGADRKEVGEVYSDVPDLISLHGPLQTSSSTVSGATLSVLFRTGQPFSGQPALLWTINCEHGEIRLVSPDSVALQAHISTAPVSINVHGHATNKVEEIPWTWGIDQVDLPLPARSVQRCLFALAEGNTSGYVSLEDAARRAEQIFGWLKE